MRGPIWEVGKGADRFWGGGGGGAIREKKSTPPFNGCGVVGAEEAAAAQIPHVVVEPLVRSQGVPGPFRKLAEHTGDGIEGKTTKSGTPNAENISMRKEHKTIKNTAKKANDEM